MNENTKPKANADTFESVIAEENERREAIRKRTAELRALRLAEESRRGPVRRKAAKAKTAKSATQEAQSLSAWLESQERQGRKT
jgi:hypothetical protein